MGWWLRSTNHSQVTLGSWPSWKHARDLWIYCVFLITADMYPSIVLSVYTICWVVIKEMKRSKIHRKKNINYQKKKKINCTTWFGFCLFVSVFLHYCKQKTVVWYWKHLSLWCNAGWIQGTVMKQVPSLLCQAADRTNPECCNNLIWSIVNFTPQFMSLLAPKVFLFFCVCVLLLCYRFAQPL